MFLRVNAYSITSPQSRALSAMPRLIFAWSSGDAPGGLADGSGNVCESNSLENESWEGQLSNENNSNGKIPEPATGKKPYKTPSLRFESVFEVSALACGKLTTTQSGCKFSTKAS
jgi:hypothetical protein